MADYIKNTQQPNDEKMRELILFISIHSEGDRRFGATKLNKLLFYADFLAYLNFNQSITGHEYQKLENGPAPRYLMPIREEMEVDGDIAIREETFYGYKQHRVLALRKPNLSVFSGEEVDLIYQIIEKFWNKNAKDVSDESHTFVGWALAEDGETIPYEATLVGSRKPTQEEIERARELEPLIKEYVS